MRTTSGEFRIFDGSTKPSRGEGRRRLSWPAGAAAIAALLSGAGFGGPGHAAAKMQVLYSFQDSKGSGPVAGLIADGAGGFYGTTWSGGAHGDGVVFELSPPTAGRKLWTETVLHAFAGTDGANPGEGLTVDAAGNLYGTTVNGGVKNDGVVFKMSPPIAGQTAWTETLLHAFVETDGQYPYTRLLADGAGNLYGTTNSGGKRHDGVAFELSPPIAGQTTWTETVLYAFDGHDGLHPHSSLIADGAGNLYGTTMRGGKALAGNVFELSPPSAGESDWTETQLQVFNGRTQGGFPGGNLIMDGAGGLYGIASLGGKGGFGVVYRLSPPSAGQTAWTETVLHNYAIDESEQPAGPSPGLIADAAGNLFGELGFYSSSGGERNDGAVFELSPPAAGQTRWIQRLLHSFDGTKGLNPNGGLVADDAGNLYGVTSEGGTHGVGIVFEVTP